MPKHSKLTVPKTGKIAKRGGGNGGYAKRSVIDDKPMVRRRVQGRDYHGNRIGRDK